MFQAHPDAPATPRCPSHTTMPLPHHDALATPRYPSHTRMSLPYPDVPGAPRCTCHTKMSEPHHNDLVTKNQDDSKKLWQTINKILHRTKSSTIPDDSSDSSLANKFGSYFIEKIMKIQTIFTSNNFHISPPVEPVAKFSSFNSVSCNDVRKILNLSPTKSCSLDPWPTFLVKECVDILINPLTPMINMSLSEGYFPDKFKLQLLHHYLRSHRWINLFLKITVLYPVWILCPN